MNILDVKMRENDAGARTIREYLRALLVAVWEDGEGFSGKRPFGNSGWEYDLYAALIEAGAVKGNLDEWGGVESCDCKRANEVIADAIDRVFTHE
jgi:hypothetical protein